ncbi:MAG: NAD-dependent epimerase/dehydratase [Pedosphaera sp.]|nr:NAD-dependent epimerase/dehydratase [Pedosphaera sp.]
MTNCKTRTKRNGKVHNPVRLTARVPGLSLMAKPLRSKPVLITGGAGFIGTNLAHRLLSAGQPVLLYDNLRRPGVERNLQWLQATHGDLLRVEVADVQNFRALRQATRHAFRVFHFAAQVAVTSSLQDPIYDFEVNARGTLNLLESLRMLPTPPPLLFTSTNKVYGDLGDVELQVSGPRYEPVDPALREHGFNESRPLNFHSPYGCSKGCACQYVLDYTRTFHLPAVAFHMSCIYGLHQLGTEDQGWVAHFLIQALENSSINIYGDGRQVRDILFVEDLIDAFLLAHEHMGTLAGQSFNMGGGPGNTISLLELIDLIAELQARSPALRFDAWRSADQRYYVSDIRKFSEATGWAPKVKVREGVTRLYEWLTESRPSASPKILPLNGVVAAGNGHQPDYHRRNAGRKPAPLKRLREPNRVNGKCTVKKLVKAP